MRRLFKYFFALLIFPFFTAAAQLPERTESLVKNEKTADQLVYRALSDTVGYHWLRQLCMLEHRLPGSPESRQALDWAENLMLSLNLDTVWRQPCMVPVWKRGKEQAEMMPAGSGKQVLQVAAIGGSVPTPGGWIEAEVLEVHSFEQLRQAGEKAKGKIIFFNRPMDSGIVPTFTAYGQAVYQRISGADEAAKAGGIAALVRSVTTKYDNVPHVGTLAYSGSVPKLPAAVLGLIDADRLGCALQQDANLKVRLKLTCEPLGMTESYNLIGEIRGTDFPEEVIVVGGHFDSWDKGEGAHDDGGGCMQALEVISLFQRLGLKPKRTVRVVFFMNEECGGLTGAVEYAEYAGQAKEIHLAAIESDRGMFTPRGFNVDADDKYLNKVQSWLPLLQKARIEWIRRGGSGPDVNLIKSANARIAYIPDDQRYFDVHHSANDVFESVHPREMQLGTAAMAILVWMISEAGLH